jgi:Uma2 family endonuclease
MGMAIAADHFTVADLEQFDGRPGRHELLDGALVVTPLGSSRHQSLCLALAVALRDHVVRHRLGAVFAPGRVVVDNRTALEPDVLVVPGPPATAALPWESHPAPLLAVEVLSPSTRSFDHVQKRSAYLRRGATEYWVVDAEERAVTVVRPGRPDEHAVGTLRWEPAGSHHPLEIDLQALFDSVEPGSAH